MAYQFRSTYSGTSADSRDLPSTPQNRHVSLANIATAFLTERKSSARRLSSGRRKKRLANQEKKSSNSRLQSSFPNGLNDLFGQRLSSENMEHNIAAMFMTTSSGAGANNKHRATLLSQEDQRLLLSSSEWVEDVKDTDPYVSVLSRLGEAIQDSETLVEFVKKSFSIVTNTYGATALLALLTVFQVILFFIGVKYLNDCPVQPNLPVYLLVAGSMGLVRLLNLLWKQFRRRRLRKLEGVELDQEEETEDNGSGFTDAVLNLFLLAWFIVGQFWTWRSFMPNFEFGLENPEKYCHKNVYIFALVHIALVYVMFLAVILFFIALTCCATFPHLIVKAPR
ncbi:hypothetical protein I4U23_009391 [Adineta vaga]|nr:hypothetical protein I4U23_009391 [Adineta vaga]